nr:hypothetical protein [Streptomyces alfalfae]
MQRRDLAEVPGRDQRGDGVAERGDHDLGEGPGVAAREMRDREDHDAPEAQAEPREAAGAQAFRVAEEAGQERADDRDGGDEEPRRGAGDVALRVGQGPPRAEDLDAREGQHRPPVATDDAAEAALPHREGEQDRRAQRAAGEDHRRR